MPRPGGDAEKGHAEKRGPRPDRAPSSRPRPVVPTAPEDVADAIVEAIESKRYEVWCPRSAAALYRATRVLPLRANDAISRMTKADEALLASIGSPERQAYNERIAQEAPSSEHVSV